MNRKRRSSNSSMKKNIYNSNFDHFYNSNNNNKKLNYNKLIIYTMKVKINYQARKMNKCKNKHWKKCFILLK